MAQATLIGSAMETSSRCLSPDELDAFRRGQMTQDERDVVSGHLMCCVSCQGALSIMIKPANGDAPPTLPADPLRTQPGYRMSEKPACDATMENTALAPQTPRPKSPPSFPFLGTPQTEEEVGRLGKYRVLSVLGSGGMGMVFLAEDIVLRRRVALKVIKPELNGREELFHRLLREARSMAGIKHENMVTVYEASQEGDVFYIAMELLKGCSLHEYIAKTSKAPNVPELLRIGREVAQGLSAIHKNGLIHRDLKPSNIWMEEPGGKVKILDFGLARPMDSEASTELTQTGTVVGTPAYMSPEQARGDDMDGRSDLFSLGTVLYCACTGISPFNAKTVVAQLMALAVDDPRPAHEVNSSIPKPLSLLIKQLMEKKPELRPNTADEVVKRLQDIEAGGSGVPERRSASALGRHDDKDSLTPESGGRSRWLIVAGLALAALCGVTAYQFLGPRGGRAVAAQIGRNNKPEFQTGAPDPHRAYAQPGEFRPPPPPRPEDLLPPPPGATRPDDLPPPPRYDNPRFEDVSKIVTLFENDAAKRSAWLLDTTVIKSFGAFFPAESGKRTTFPGIAPPNAFSSFSIQNHATIHAIGLHPVPPYNSNASFKLDGLYRSLHLLVSQNDGLPPTVTQITFDVIGDGKYLWTSRPVQSQKETQRCDVSVSGVNTLDLQIRSDGDPRAAHMIWFDPYLEK